MAKKNKRKVATIQQINVSQITQPKIIGTCKIEIDVLAEREELIKQNTFLRNQNAEFCRKLEISEILLRDRDERLEKEHLIIEELKRENEKLIEENAELRRRINVMESVIITLKSEIDIIKFDKLRENIIFAIQGANGYHKLETRIDRNYVQYLRNLKIDGNEQAHYINNDVNKRDTPELANYKDVRLLQILEDHRIKEVLDDIEYDYEVGFIDAVKGVLKKVINSPIVEPSKIEKSRIDRYWK